MHSMTIGRPLAVPLLIYIGRLAYLVIYCWESSTYRFERRKKNRIAMAREMLLLVCYRYQKPVGTRYRNLLRQSLSLLLSCHSKIASRKFVRWRIVKTPIEVRNHSGGNVILIQFYFIVTLPVQSSLFSLPATVESNHSFTVMWS